MRYVVRFPAFEDQGFSGLHRFAGAAANYIFANSPPPKNRYNLMAQSLTVSSACGQLAAACTARSGRSSQISTGNELDSASNCRGVAFQRGFGDL